MLMIHPLSSGMLHRVDLVMDKAVSKEYYSAFIFMVRKSKNNYESNQQDATI